MSADEGKPLLPMDGAAKNSTSNSPGGGSNLMQQKSSGMSGTDWHLVEQAAAERDQPGEALDHLARRYWPAIFAFIRASGRSIEDAADLTQGFICDVLLSRALLDLADQQRGRFRNLLLRSLQNYLYERHRYENRIKRAPRDGQPIQMDEQELSACSSEKSATPEQAFQNQWSVTLVRRVLDIVRRQCLEEGLEVHWRIFELRIVRPMLHGDTPAPYHDLIDRLGITDASQASNMMITVKRRFARVLQDEVAATVDDIGDVEQEIRSILRDLGKQG